MKKSGYSVAIVGATGLVGREILSALGERVFPLSALAAYGTHSSLGEEVVCGSLSASVAALDSAAKFDAVDIVFLCAGDRVSAEWAERATAAGTVVVDLSGLYVDDLDIPVIVPEVNASDVALYSRRRIVASPDVVTVAAAVVLEPLRSMAPLRRTVITSIESASGAGRAGVAELEQQTLDLMSGREPDTEVFAQRLAFNVLPQVGEFLAGGGSLGEGQTRSALRRVLNDPELAISVTRVRAPLFFGTAVSLNVEFGAQLNADRIREHLRKAPGLLVVDDPAEQTYPTPAQALAEDATSVGRIRLLDSQYVADVWITIDNTRKGAAVNAVEIAEVLVRDHL